MTKKNTGYTRSENRGDYHGENFSGSIFKGLEEPEILNPKKIFSVILYRKWSILTIIVIATVGAYFYSKSLLPVYESRATIIVSDQSTGKASSEGSLQELINSAYGLQLNNSVANQIEILKSRSVSDGVAKRLTTAYSDNDIALENFPLLWSSYKEDSTLVSMRQLSARIGEVLGVSRSSKETDIIVLSFSSHSAKEASYMVNLVVDYFAELSTDNVRMASSSALEFLQNQRKKVKEDLERAEIELKEFRDTTGLMDLASQTSSLVNRIYELEARKQEFIVQKEAVALAIQNYEKQIDGVQPELIEKIKNGVNNRLELLQFRLAELQTERLLIKARNSNVTDVDLSAEPGIAQIDRQIDEIESHIDQSLNELFDSSDLFLGFLGGEGSSVTETILSTRSKLLELYINKAQLESQIAVIDKRLETDNTFVEKLPELELQFVRLKRNLVINEQLFLEIDKQYTETALIEQTQFGSARPLDYGLIPNNPKSPNVLRITIIGFFIGALFGVGIAVVREVTNTVIDSVEKLENFKYPLLAIIPDLKEYLEKAGHNSDWAEIGGVKFSTSLITLLDNISPASEAFRRLHNNIIYSRPDEDFKIIMFTSPGKGDGKTTSAGNIAVSLAEAGKKVLIIDADLRRPRVHTDWGEVKEPGIMEVLFDDIDLRDAIKPATICENVFMLTAGRKPPNPSAINRSKKLRDLIMSLKEEYDHILIDTAPYGIITDAAPLMKIADGIVIVSRFNKTHDYELKHTIQQLERINVNIIGHTLMAYKHFKSSDYYYTKSMYYKSNSYYHDSSKG